MHTFVNTVLTGITSGAIYSLMAIALVLVWRSTRVVNFAQAGQALLTTYIGYACIVQFNSFWLALVIAMLSGALIGAFIDAFFMRTLFRRVSHGPIAGVAPIIATLGLLGLIRAGLGITIALHALVLLALLSYEPARKALLAAAPIMINLIAPPTAEPPKPLPPTELPKPKPMAKQPVQRTFEPQLLATPADLSLE